jgi:hypothetical protein
MSSWICALRFAFPAVKNCNILCMYAGIGYFTIPFIKGGAAHVHACEMNPNRSFPQRRTFYCLRSERVTRLQYRRAE